MNSIHNVNTRQGYAPACGCPHPEKGRYHTQTLAERSAAWSTLHTGKQIYTYGCSCGFYHLTSRAPVRATVTWDGVIAAGAAVLHPAMELVA